MALRILNTSLVKGGEFCKMCRTDNILIVTKEKKKKVPEMNFLLGYQ